LAADAEPASTYSTLLKGLNISFFFPLLSLFFFKDAEPHSFLGPGRDIDTTGGAVFSFVPRRSQSNFARC
jgi:hypothetical protein